MNYMKYIQIGFFAFMALFSATSLSSCENDIEAGKIDTTLYENTNKITASLSSIQTVRDTFVIELPNSEVKTDLVFKLSKPLPYGLDAQLSVASDLVEKYNEDHQTEFELFPIDLVDLEEDGHIILPPGEVKSELVSLTFSRGDLSDINKEYLLPIQMNINDDVIDQETSRMVHYYIVKFVSERPNTNKGDIKTICYIEVNDDNILNAGEFTMAQSGKPLVDILHIFAANINFDAETGRVYVQFNPNTRHVLENKDLYIKPLQEKGIKVCLSILGNHDEAGVANLAPETAAEFAKELKVIVDTYELDGIDFDNEYSTYEYWNPSPGFTRPSGESSNRLIYETRRLMPDKIITWYQVKDQSPKGFCEGKSAGELLDYAYNAYYGQWREGWKDITNLSTAQYGPYPLDIKKGVYALGSTMNRLKRGGYGVNVLYNMHVYDEEFQKVQNYQSGLSSITRIYYNDEVEWSGIYYKKGDNTAYNYFNN